MKKDIAKEKSLEAIRKTRCCKKFLCEDCDKLLGSNKPCPYCQQKTNPLTIDATIKARILSEIEVNKLHDEWGSLDLESLCNAWQIRRDGIEQGTIEHNQLFINFSDNFISYVYAI